MLSSIRIFIAFLLFAVCMGSFSFAQQSTTGPVPPPGTDRGLRTPSRSQVVIPGVPSYLWHHGCGPTAAGMVVGYWDQYYPLMIEGEALSQTADVDAMMADDSQMPVCGAPNSDHYQDYSCPREDGGPVLPDCSESGPCHENNCLADYMNTSRSIYGNRYGWSHFRHVDDALQLYFAQVAPGLEAQVQNYGYNYFSFEDYKNEIDNSRPLVLLVDIDGNGITDHFVTGIGYNDITQEYAIYDTWDNEIHWYAWNGLSAQPWSIYGFTVVSGFNWIKPYFAMDSCRFLDSDGDGFHDVGDTIQLIIYLKNYGVATQNVSIAAACNHPDVEMMTSEIWIDQVDGYGADFDNQSSPIEYIIPELAESVYDSFFVSVEAAEDAVVEVFAMEYVLGRTQLFLVDDDRGDNFEEIYSGDLYSLRIPAHIWDKSAEGSPTGGQLTEYHKVFWFTGDSTDDFLQPEDINAIKTFLDAGGYLFLTGQGLAGELHLQDSAFLEDYLHCRYDGQISYTSTHDGINGSPIGDGLNLRLGSGQTESLAQAIIPVNGASADFKSNYMPNDLTAVSYSGNSRVVFFTFGYEAISNNFSGYTIRDTVLTRILSFFSDVTCGDANNDDAINILDITFLISYLYMEGPEPESTWAADPDGNGAINILDVTYLISNLYMGGPAPVCR